MLIAGKYGARSYAHLSGDPDPESALCDVFAAEECCPTYSPTYTTMAHVHYLMGETGKALDVLANAVKGPYFLDDLFLVNMLIMSQLGFSHRDLRTKEEFDEWMNDVLVNDLESVERMKGVGEAWYTRCEEIRVALP
ncbi:hypothetical protein Hypma_000450 [Hypsizygus marmoreus]|uniref:Uncharacterized protein n=1 Tax=Hypsizygus marmoreus TaxID=39966 RepID=A0A369JAJ6_HYPMA|nr:hypothetical protein Hypma_000450 [Hypsizygus marmoreus]